MKTEGWTVKEAVDHLETKVPYRTLDLWVRMRLKPIGTRKTGRAGRPPFIYAENEIRAVHREIIDIYGGTSE